MRKTAPFVEVQFSFLRYRRRFKYIGVTFDLSAKSHHLSEKRQHLTNNDDVRALNKRLINACVRCSALFYFGKNNNVASSSWTKL